MTNQNNPEDCISECIFESAEENIIIENSGMEGSSVLNGGRPDVYRSYLDDYRLLYQ